MMVWGGGFFRELGLLAFEKRDAWFGAFCFDPTSVFVSVFAWSPVCARG